MEVYVRSLSPKAVNNVSTRRSSVPARILRILQVSSWLTVWPGGRRSPSAFNTQKRFLIAVPEYIKSFANCCLSGVYWIMKKLGLLTNLTNLRFSARKCIPIHTIKVFLLVFQFIFQYLKLCFLLPFSSPRLFLKSLISFKHSSVSI